MIYHLFVTVSRNGMVQDSGHHFEAEGVTLAEAIKIFKSDEVNNLLWCSYDKIQYTVYEAPDGTKWHKHGKKRVARWDWMKPTAGMGMTVYPDQGRRESQERVAGDLTREEWHSSQKE